MAVQTASTDEFRNGTGSCSELAFFSADSNEFIIGLIQTMTVQVTALRVISALILTEILVHSFYLICECICISKARVKISLPLRVSAWVINQVQKKFS